MPAKRSVLRLARLILLDDWPLKIFCLLFATLYWVYIDGELSDEIEVRVKVPLAALPLPPRTRFAPEWALPEFHVKVRGPRRRLQFLTPEHLKLDLREAAAALRPGKNRVAVLPGMVRVEGMQDMDVIGVKPESFALELFRIHTKTLPVKIRIQGKLRPGYRLVGAKLEPSEAAVTAVEDLDAAEPLRTRAIDVTGRFKDFEVTVPLAPEVRVGEREVKVEGPQEVKVRLLIRREEITRLLEGVPVRALAPPGAAMHIEPRTVRVSVRGAPEDVAALRNTDIRLYAEWPVEWAVKRVPGEPTGEKAVQVKAIAPPRVIVTGEKERPLPVVKVRGVLTDAWAAP